MTVQESQKELSCSTGDQTIDVMEVVDSPLNLVSLAAVGAITS